MAAAAGPATPQRPLPGAFMATPAIAPAPTIFAANAASLRQHNQPPSESVSNDSTTAPQNSTSVERAARTINDTLAQEARFPDLESYVAQGMSGEYDLPTSPAWKPFQKVRQYDLPPRLLEQSNRADLRMQMGIFSPLGHAWAVLDNCLYLWDYTLPNPELIAWEDNPHPIEAVQLVRPKPGVFVREITHLIVVATNAEMTLLGTAVQTMQTGAKTVNLYSTKMSINVRGMGVRHIAHSSKTGRIFFAGSQTDDLYEFHYQQNDSWFTSRTQCVNHSRETFGFVPENVKMLGSFFGAGGSAKVIEQIVVDDSRMLLYTLSNTSEIKTWTIRNSVQPALARPIEALLQNAFHFCPKTEILTGRNAALTSLSAIPASEANRVCLMATTILGCRLYLSVTSGGFSGVGNEDKPTSMQILHVRYPPRDPDAPLISTQQYQTGVARPAYGVDNIDYNSQTLAGTSQALRLPPGYFMAFLQNRGESSTRLFCSAPDTARLKTMQETIPPNQRFAEFGTFLDLPGDVTQVASLDEGHAGASNSPLGFGNELAFQFDRPSTEIAIMTGNAIQLIRRRRLVDVFASMMRYGSSDEEGREGDIKRFVRSYGRTETAATALAVACGQGTDVTPESQITSITDPEVLDGARRAFIAHGGSAAYNANALPENSGSAVDSVRPSPRHDGMALYVSRIIRSIWTTTIIKEEAVPGVGVKLAPSVDVVKLRRVQKDLNSLSDFLNDNKSFIEGLAGPQPLARGTTRQDEIQTQGEHRAMTSLLKLVSSIVEAISFVLVLFDEKLEDILSALSEESRANTRKLTFESLCVSDSGRELAKELVKAIVNRNIASGSNVDTVAEALRRRCGSFCSSDDVVIFKAQEQVKRASEAGGQSEAGRMLLNESQRLFQKVAASLSMDHLQWAAQQYVQMNFYAGAIELCLIVAAQRDPARRAQSWIKEGMPQADARKAAFDARKSCYDLVFETIQALDAETGKSADAMDGQYNLATRRKNEAYNVVNNSEDAVFQSCLYDWYVNNGEADRLLDIDTHFVVDYLQRRSQEDRIHADLLWRYHAHHNDYLQAASVQLDLARGYFDLGLEERIEYLSRARTNASTRTTSLLDSRQNKQQLLREISDLLDVANIQDDILQRMKSEPRLTGERREEVLTSLSGAILPVDTLFNQYADQASYYDICLTIYQVADHRNPADIKASWQALLDQTDDQAQAQYGRGAVPWETVSEKVRELGRRLSVNDATFPIQTLLPMLQRYAIQPREHKPPPTWALDLFLDLDIPHETLLPVLEQMYYSNEHPFTGGKRKVLAAQMVSLLKSWYVASERRGDRVCFGSEENASVVLDCASTLLRTGELDAAARADAEGLLTRVQREMR